MLPYVLQSLNANRLNQIITSTVSHTLHNNTFTIIRRHHCNHHRKTSKFKHQCTPPETDPIRSNEALTDNRKVHLQPNVLQKFKSVHVRHMHIAYNNVKPIFVLSKK
ncbi:hypothetical protein V8G54_014656 [Vigna mungo]|uniref:Uncharacterized protein n=1 Tax=Vigna mungo TaxID=3915 RepID=A0AAQ3RZF3_VIGMU